MKFPGRVVVVTGASQGIGRAIGEAFVREGASLAICARTKDAIEEVAREIGPNVYGAPCNVASEDEVNQFVGEVRVRFGRIDVLVNNAGETSTALLSEMDSVFWNRMLATNLTGVFLASKAVIPTMMEQRYGRIVNIASMSGKRGSRYLSAYSATKHGVIGFTQCVALEVADFGIIVNAICPGYVDTPNQELNVQNIMKDRGLPRDEVRKLMEQKNARRRFISMEEVAQAAIMLSEENTAVTGQAIDLW